MRMKEWNISYCIHDGYGGLDEFMVVLPKFWKVVRWLIMRGRECYEIYIWTSHKIADGEDAHG